MRLAGDAQHDACAFRVPVAIRAIQLLLVVLVAVFVSSLVIRTEGRIEGAFEGVTATLAMGLCAVLCLLRAKLLEEDRVAFALLGVGCVLFTSGNVAYMAMVDFPNPIPFPSIADVGYLGIYPFLIVAVLMLGRSEIAGRQFVMWLDGIVGVLGVAALGSALVLHTTLSSLSGDPLTVIVGAAYPLAGLLVLSMVVGILTLNGRRPDRRLMAMAAGLLIFVCADIIYLLRLTSNSYLHGTVLDSARLVGLAVLSLSAWQPTRDRDTEPITGAGSLVVALASSLLAVVVLVVASARNVPEYAVAFAAAALVVGLVRVVAAFHQHRQLVEARLNAITDDLTGLSNRRAFSNFLEHTLESTPPNGGVAVLLLDLDRFKEINDLFGHQMGDLLLKEIGPRLTPIVRPDDLFSRLGGDEFGLVLRGVDRDAAVQIAQRICDLLRTPFTLDNVTNQITGSIGIALWPGDADNAADLFQCADVAMYAAKANHTDVEVYDAEHGADGRDRLAMAKELHLAADAGQFVVHYQPKIDLRSGKITGVEALVRWNHPQQGVLYPDEFLPVAEQTGSMQALRTKVLAAAIDQCRQWRLDGLDLSMAVNLSASDLLDEKLVNEIAMLLARSDTSSASLELEITETTLMRDPRNATATLLAIHDLGVTLSVDDYGTGFSSLTYLRDLPVQTLKLDRTFITDLTEHSRDAAIVRSTIELGHSLGLQVVAEGVESAEVMALLRVWNCDLAQGYYICRPKPADELTEWLRTQPIRTHATTWSGRERPGRDPVDRPPHGQAMVPVKVRPSASAVSNPPADVPLPLIEASAPRPDSGTICQVPM